MEPKLKPEPPVPIPPAKERLASLIKRSMMDFDPGIPLRRYCNSLQQMLSMANTHCDDGNYEKSFILYHKYIDLCIDKFKKHPEYSKLTPEKQEMYRRHSRSILEMLECIKKNFLLPRYEKEYEQYIAAKQAYDAELKLYNDSQKSLKEKCIEQESRERTERLQREFDERIKQLSDPGAVPKAFKPNSVSTHIIPSNIDVDNLPEVSLDNLELESSGEEEGDSDNDVRKQLPSAPPLPTVPDRSTKPTNLLSTYGDTDELTRMIVPFKAVTEKFMNLARSNTLKNIETCAILGGKLSQNAFTITHLLVPKQAGTSDTCAATNEEELFIEQEKQDLLTIGWIHTHPTQKAFLSSVDLHTHAPYQKMLPEAIAIVIAPKFDEIGVYSLSEYGLEFILKCRQTGFHPHPNESQIYGKAGHVLIDDTLDVQIVDFR